MRVLFVTPYYPPEVGAAQIRIQELASRLSASDCQVSVLTTFPSYPSGIVPQEWRGKLFRRDVDDGVTVHRVWSYATRNRGFLRRITGHLAFAMMATLAMFRIPKHDVMIIESPPLFDGLVGVVAGALRRTPYVFMVSDLWPESAVQMGVLRHPGLIGIAKHLELLFYKRAAAILALTRGIREGMLNDGVNSDKIVLFRNSVDCDFFRPGLAADEMRRRIGATSADFVAMYAGTFGLAQGLSTVLDAAAHLKQQGLENIRFVLAGDGAESELLREKAKVLGLRNVVIWKSIPKQEMPALLNAADTVVIPLRDLAVFRGALPTKLFEAMACGKPVILGVKGEAEVVLREAEAGICITPENPGELAEAIAMLASDRIRSTRLGSNGRGYVAKHFDRNQRALELKTALQSLVRKPSESDDVLTVAASPRDAVG